jgi:hypothetical protein
MGLLDRIKSRRTNSRSRIGIALSRIKGRRINQRKKLTTVRSKPVKDKLPVEFIVVERTDDEINAKDSGFYWLVKKLGFKTKKLTECGLHDSIIQTTDQEAALNIGNESRVNESAVDTHLTGWEWICVDVNNTDELGKEDSFVQTAALEATSNTGNWSNAPESAVNRHAGVTGWGWIGCCLGWGSPHRAGTQTSERSNDGGGTGETLQSSSHWSKYSSYDDEESGESSQPAVSQVDKVLTLSAMVDEISDISSSDSDDDESDSESEK